MHTEYWRRIDPDTSMFVCILYSIIVRLETCRITPARLLIISMCHRNKERDQHSAEINYTPGVSTYYVRLRLFMTSAARHSAFVCDSCDWEVKQGGNKASTKVRDRRFALCM